MRVNAAYKILAVYIVQGRKYSWYLKKGKMQIRNQVEGSQNLPNSVFVTISKLQLLTALCVGLTAVRHGANIAITSEMVYEFEENSDEFVNMSLEEASWMRKWHKTSCLSRRLNFLS